MKRSWRMPALVAGGLAVAASVLVMPELSPSVSVAAFVPPSPVAVAHYDLGDAAFTDPYSGTVSELRAVVHHPRVLHRGTPLVVLSDGSRYACDALAVRGFVVVSVSAGRITGTSDRAGELARLIDRHRQMWQQLADTGGGPLAGRFTDAGTGRRVDPPFRGHVDPRHAGPVVGGRGRSDST